MCSTVETHPSLLMEEQGSFAFEEAGYSLAV